MREKISWHSHVSRRSWRVQVWPLWPWRSRMPERSDAWRQAPVVQFPSNYFKFSDGHNIKQNSKLTPFLRYSHLFNSYIGRPKSFKYISNSDFAAFPPFMKSNSIINMTNNRFTEFLQSLSTRVKGSKLVFRGNINENHSTDFKNHFQLLYYIGNELLTLFNSCRAYKFLIEFHSDKSRQLNLFLQFYKWIRLSAPQMCPFWFIGLIGISECNCRKKQSKIGLFLSLKPKKIA